MKPKEHSLTRIQPSLPKEVYSSTWDNDWHSNGLYPVANSAKQDLCNSFNYPPQIFWGIKPRRLPTPYGKKNTKLTDAGGVKFLTAPQTAHNHLYNFYPDRQKSVSVMVHVKVCLKPTASSKNTHFSFSKLAHILFGHLWNWGGNISNATAEFSLELILDESHKEAGRACV